MISFGELRILRAGCIKPCKSWGSLTKKKIKLLLMDKILHHQGWWLSHYLQGFNHPRWCRSSSINSMCIFWLQFLQFLQLGLVGYPFPIKDPQLTTAETENNGKPWNLNDPCVSLRWWTTPQSFDVRWIGPQGFENEFWGLDPKRPWKISWVTNDVF